MACTRVKYKRRCRVKCAGVLQERARQSFAVVAMTVLADITTTSRPQPVLVYLYRHRVRPVMPHHFRADFCVTSVSRRERIDIAFGFLTGDP